MKIKQVNGIQLVPEVTRKYLETVVYPSADRARQDIQHCFPNHVVCEDAGRLRVAVRDKSFFIADFMQIG